MLKRFLCSGNVSSDPSRSAADLPEVTDLHRQRVNGLRLGARRKSSSAICLGTMVSSSPWKISSGERVRLFGQVVVKPKYICLKKVQVSW
jgi:hypothetical protein